MFRPGGFSGDMTSQQRRASSNMCLTGQPKLFAQTAHGLAVICLIPIGRCRLLKVAHLETQIVKYYHKLHFENTILLIINAAGCANVLFSETTHL